MIFDILGALIDSALLYRLFNNLLHFRFNPKYWYISGIASMMVLAMRYVICLGVSDFADYIIRIAFNIAIFLIAFIFYTDNTCKKIVISFLYFLVLLIAETLVMIILIISTQRTVEFIGNTHESINNACMFASKLIAFYLIEQLSFRFQYYKNITFHYMKELTIVLIFNFILFALAIRAVINPDSDNSNQNTLLIIVMGITFVSFLSSCLISMIAKKSRKEMEYQLELSRLEMEHKYYEDMSDILNNLRSLRHDMNNHIGIMHGLIDTKQYDDLKEYLKDIYTDACHSNDYIFLEDKTLSILLNTKIDKATSLNIDMDVDITISSLPFSIKDMSTIIGNMLDNAIEAAGKVTEHPFISVTMSKTGQYYRIYCRNNFLEKPKKQNGKFITNKKDNKNHEMGITNIKTAVNNYNGKVTINVTDVFEMIIEVEADN